MIQIIMKYIVEEIQLGHYKETVDSDQQEEEAFRADAKAEKEMVGIGGWETRGNKKPGEARWYSLMLTRKNAPWVFEGGEPYTKIATLELLATMISVIAFRLKAALTCFGSGTALSAHRHSAN